MTDALVNPMIQNFSQAISPERLEGIEMTVQLKLSGEGGGDWYLDIRENQYKLIPGVAQNASLTIESSIDDFKNLVEGKLDGAQAFMTGKLRVQGNMMVMLKLASIMGKKAQ